MNLYCVVDCKPIPPERVAKKAVTCCDQCASEYRRQRRQERAEKACRLCGRKFRQRRNSGVVLHEHTEVSESVGLHISDSGINSEFSASGVSAALTSGRQEQSTPKVLIGSEEISENFSSANKLHKNESFTEQSNSQCEVETLLTVGAELPVESRPQVKEQDFHACPVEVVEMSQNEVR